MDPAKDLWCSERKADKNSLLKLHELLRGVKCDGPWPGGFLVGKRGKLHASLEGADLDLSQGSLTLLI